MRGNNPIETIYMVLVASLSLVRQGLCLTRCWMRDMNLPNGCSLVAQLYFPTMNIDWFHLLNRRSHLHSSLLCIVRPSLALARVVRVMRRSEYEHHTYGHYHRDSIFCSTNYHSMNYHADCPICLSDELCPFVARLPTNVARALLSCLH